LIVSAQTIWSVIFSVLHFSAPSFISLCLGYFLTLVGQVCLAVWDHIDRTASEVSHPYLLT